MKPFVAPSFSYIPLEETLEIIPKHKKLFIGIPKTSSFDENRVPLSPEAVAVLINLGHEITIESGAGDGAYYLDNDYSEAGAKIAYSKEEVYKASTIIKSAPIDEAEIALLEANQIILSPIHVPLLKVNMLEQLIKKKVIAIAFESVQDDAGNYPIVRSMSEIAGYSAILTAAQYLSNQHKGKGILLGGISEIGRASCRERV